MQRDIPASIATLLPFPLFSATADTMSSKDIVSAADSSSQLNTLVAGLEAARLVDTLQGAGPFTLFAPTDAAFLKLPAGVLDFLLKPQNAQELVALFAYHVVVGNFKAATVMTTSNLTALNGGALTLSLSGKAVKINDSTVIKADVAASNGTLHVIDTVLLPR